MLQYCLYDLVTAATRKEPAEKQTSQTTNLYIWLKQGIGWQRDWVDIIFTVVPLRSHSLNYFIVQNPNMTEILPPTRTVEHFFLPCTATFTLKSFISAVRILVAFAFFSRLSNT